MAHDRRRPDALDWALIVLGLLVLALILTSCSHFDAWRQAAAVGATKAGEAIDDAAPFLGALTGLGSPAVEAVAAVLILGGSILGGKKVIDRRRKKKADCPCPSS